MNFQTYSHTGSIMQKIEELREWQHQQHEKLLHQQEEQRLLLSNEQHRMYEVFGLQNMDACHVQLSKSTISPHFNSSPNRKSQDFTPEEDDSNNDKDEFPSDLSARETGNYNPYTNPILQTVMKDNSKERHTLDETPVASLNKDFHQLLQEKLEQYGGGDNNHSAFEDKHHKPKRKFLRKGEGLARFRMKPTLLHSQKNSNGMDKIKRTLITNQPNRSATKLSNQSDKSRKNASSSVTNTNKSKVKEKRSKNCVASDKSHTAGLSKTSKSWYPKSAVPKLTLKTREALPSIATWADVLQNQQGPKLQSLDADPKVQQRTDLPQSSPAMDSIEISFLEKVKDADKKSKKEVEELKIFELLEQHAANSSFCSTSSLVARLMEGPINSTPVKNHLLGAPQNYQNEKCTASPLHSYSRKGHSKKDQMLLGSLQFHNKSTSCGYLPYGLDNADNENPTDKGLTNELKFGAYEKNRSPKLTVRSTSHWKSDDGERRLNTSSNSIRMNNSGNSPCNKPLHVRFAETNEYKSLSDGDTSFSSQSDTSRNIDYGDDHDSHKLEITNKRSRNSKHFQDDQAWSDGCSCTSSEESRSPNTSFSTTYQSFTMLQSPKPSSQHQTVNQHQVIHTFPVDVETSVYSPLNDCANTHPHTDGQDQTDFGATTQSKGNSEIVFKSTLLRTRLEELEKEIDIFRKENANLQKIKRKHEEDVSRFNKDKIELERKRNEEKEKMESFIHEERKKLNKERSVFEKYCKDLRNQPTKQEREEIQTLKQQLADLQMEMHKKDSRWSAAQIRTRNRLKQLEQENAQLKNEVEKLKKEKSQIKMVKSNTRRNHGVSTAKILHAVNDHITKIKPTDLEDSIVVHDVVSTKKISESVLQKQNSLQHRQAKAKQPSAKINEWGNMCNKVYHAYPIIPDLNPLPSAEKLLEIHEDGTSKNIVINHRTANNSHQNNKATVANELTVCHTPLDIVSSSSEDDDIKKTNGTTRDVPVDNNKIHMAIYEAFYPGNRSDTNSVSKHVPSQQLHPVQNDNGEEATHNYDNKYEQSTKNGVPDHFSSTDSEQENSSLSLSVHTSNTSQQCKTSSTQNSSAISKPSEGREKVYPDGRKEIWYPNGNLKKTSADGSLTKMIYYNGDVKETLSDGTVKYFYAETRIWHTTYAYGLEILEFPEGQTERHQKDGTKEVTYPNGSVRTCFPDGREEWIFQDGLVVKTDPSLDERVLLLPNGQREVHYKGEMRREYPDGTVKTVYADGKLETRYANGRIRVRDSDGNLIMDSIIQRL